MQYSCFQMLGKWWLPLEITICCIVLNVLCPAIWINRFAFLGYISVSTIDLLGPGQHWENQQFKKRHLEKLESESETNKTNCVNEEKMFRLSQDFWNKLYSYYMNKHSHFRKVQMDILWLALMVSRHQDDCCPGGDHQFYDEKFLIYHKTIFTTFFRSFSGLSLSSLHLNLSESQAQVWLVWQLSQIRKWQNHLKI